MFTDYVTGVLSGLGVAAMISLAIKARRTANAMSAFASGETMTHDQLLADVMQLQPTVTLTSLQASQLVDEYSLQYEHFNEAMTRNSELHSELAQVKHVANKHALEAAHCRACCDELRAKLHASDARFKLHQLEVGGGV